MAGRFTICLLMGAGAVLGCRNAPSTCPAARVVVSNTYLAAAVKDLLGPGEPVETLAGPGQCPGHFDLRPGQLARIARCRVLLRFDFQSFLDRKLQRVAKTSLRIVSVTVPQGLCVPQGYLAACRQVAEAMVAEGLLAEASAGRRLAAIDKRLTKLAAEAKSMIRRAHLADTPVLASNHQAAACRWLGLKVVGTFSAADNPSGLQSAIRLGRQHGVRLIIGNVPQGRNAPDRLAEVLNARVVMFDNFPSSSRASAFDALLRSNLDRIQETARS